WAFDLFGNAVQFERRCDHGLCLAAPGLHSEPPKAFQTERLALHTVGHGPCYVRDLVLFLVSLGPLPQQLDTILRILVVVNSYPSVESTCEDVVEGCRQASVLPFEQLESWSGYDIRGAVGVKSEIQPVPVGVLLGCLGILIYQLAQRQPEVESTANGLASMQVDPSIQCRFHICGGIAANPPPVGRVRNVHVQQCLGESNRCPPSGTKTMLDRNSVEMRNYEMAATRHQVSGGSHPGGGASGVAPPARRSASTARAKESAVCCKSWHRANLARRV